MIAHRLWGEVHQYRMARTLLGRNVYFTTAYLVDGLMIDTGCAHTAGELLEALSGERVERIVNTHSHEDHFGANAEIQERFEVEALAHPLALPVLADPRCRRLRPYQKVMWGWPRPSRGTPVGERVETGRHVFEVLHTPGHSLDHICLFERERGWLFTGDTYIGGKDRALRADYDVWEIIASLKKLAALDVEMLFPGSGTVRDKAREVLADKVAYLEGLGEEVLALYERGVSPERIRKRLLGREGSICLITLGHFSGRQLIRAYLRERRRPG